MTDLVQAPAASTAATTAAPSVPGPSVPDPFAPGPSIAPPSISGPAVPGPSTAAPSVPAAVAEPTPSATANATPAGDIGSCEYDLTPVQIENLRKMTHIAQTVAPDTCPQANLAKLAKSVADPMTQDQLLRFRSYIALWMGQQRPELVQQLQQQQAQQHFQQQQQNLQQQMLLQQSMLQQHQHQQVGRQIQSARQGHAASKQPNVKQEEHESQSRNTPEQPQPAQHLQVGLQLKQPQEGHFLGTAAGQLPDKILHSSQLQVSSCFASAIHNFLDATSVTKCNLH